MGTNYYTKEKTCPTCGHTPEGLHLGKSSGGWTFSFQYNGGRFYKNAKEMKKWLVGKRIVDEYGREVSHEEFWKMVEECTTFFEQFPYTTSSKIAEVTKIHDHLKMGQIAQFIADMPKEAVEVMKQYNEFTKKICDKQAVFYIIADKKDFKNTTSRRDPILLAQSPFGHFWQILGAWDDEMLFLEEL